MLKKEIAKKEITRQHNCSGYCAICHKKWAVIDKMAEANIPAGYWLLNMKNFEGPEILKQHIIDYTENLDKNYSVGNSFCLAGNQGTGKTMSSICVLKAAIKKNYTAYYLTASDLLSELTSGKNYELRQKIKNVDFLLIDELDSRFFSSDATKILFSGIYENIFRSRCHNLLPTIICTNETEEILNVFYGSAVAAISSLNQQYLKIFPVVGKDFRRKTV